MFKMLHLKCLIKSLNKGNIKNPKDYVDIKIKFLKNNNIVVCAASEYLINQYENNELIRYLIMSQGDFNTWLIYLHIKGCVIHISDL